MAAKSTPPSPSRTLDDDPSRYARRSAHLPHIGEEAGREVLRALRTVALPPR